MLLPKSTPSGSEIIDEIPKILFYTWFSVFACLTLVTAYVGYLGLSVQENALTLKNTHLAAPGLAAKSAVPCNADLMKCGRAVLRGGSSRLRWR